MKKIKLLKLLLIAVVFNSANTVFAQNEGSASALEQMILDGDIRYQFLNQYTSIFISSPNSGTNLQNMHNDSNQVIYGHSDKLYSFDSSTNNYTNLDPDESNIAIPMEPGRGYVLQIGGNGNYSQVVKASRKQDFSGGSSNTGTISVGVSANKLALLGNPYSGFLDLDAFLLDANNKNTINGPVYLWTHNTIASFTNNPNSVGIIPFSNNDYALYNVLGGVAAGRNIGSSADNGIYSGLQTPNGTICWYWFFC